MNYEDVFYAAMEKVTGLGKDDFEEYKNVNLIESVILDSLSIAGLLVEISRLSGKEIKMEDLKPEDFSTIDALSHAVSFLLK